MTVYQKTIIGFNPVKEFKTMMQFGKEHPDWKKREDSTIATYFVKEESVVCELDEVSE